MARWPIACGCKAPSFGGTSAPPSGLRSAVGMPRTNKQRWGRRLPLLMDRARAAEPHFRGRWVWQILRLYYGTVAHCMWVQGTAFRLHLRSAKRHAVGCGHAADKQAAVGPEAALVDGQSPVCRTPFPRSMGVANITSVLWHGGPLHVGARHRLSVAPPLRQAACGRLWACRGQASGGGAGGCPC